MAGDRTADACVVGLGTSGLAAIEELHRRGLSVIGVDAGRVAAAAAGRNGGFLLGGAAMFLHDALEAWGPSVLDLYRATLAEVDAIPDARRVGSIRLATDEAERLDCARHAETLRTHGFAVEAYDGPLGQGLFLPDDAAVNPAVRALRRVAGWADLFEHTQVLAVEPGRVHTSTGTVSVGVVIVAVDGRLEVLVPQLADRVRTARLQMLCTEPVPARLPCPVYARWGYDYAQQDSDGRLFAGGGRDRFRTQEWTDSTEPTVPVQAWIEQVAIRLAGQPVTVTHRWAASVGFTTSGRPLVTEVATGVVACGGYNGTGNLVGPVAARSAVALALDATPPPPWADDGAG